VADYTVTTRRGPKVERERYGSLDRALTAMEQRGAQLEQEAHAEPVGVRLVRRFEPVQQVVARIELAGPGRLRAGIDVRGDGSSEGFTGRLRRKLIDQRRGESPYEALRREVWR
jgi:hypothetical protein